MKRKRIHNDIKVTWVFLQDDLPYVIDQEKSKVYLHSPFGKSEISDFAVSENVVEWTFYGKDQKIPGKYSLTLSVNEGEEGMVTIDKCNFVELVSCSCKEGGSDECNVRTESIDLVSNISLGGGGGSYDDTKIKKDIADLQEKDKATDAELAELSAEIGKKQDTITDLADIRSGAAKGATALQSVPATYATKTDVSNAIAAAITNELNADF